MTLIKYKNIKLKPDTLKIIDQANVIIGEYSKQGYTLTLRQLYYQFVSRDIIPNTHRSYKNLGEKIVNGRLAGLISWDAVVDRTRNLCGITTYQNPQSMIESMIKRYASDFWENVPIRIEVWVEKDALVDVVAHACNPWQIDFMSTRGYCSITEVWEASQRFNRYIDALDQVMIIHLSDHDPSGIDMTKDLNNRLRNVFDCQVVSTRLALTMDQVRQYNPPPNPVKQSDSRCPDYESKYGNKSWELDALPPNVIVELIDSKIVSTIKKYIPEINRVKKQIEQQRKELALLTSSYDKAIKAVTTKPKKPRKKK